MNRIDTYVQAIGDDQLNGAYASSIHRAGGRRKELINVPGMTTDNSEICRPGTDGRWRYLVIQNFWDSNADVNERASIYIDDIYLQFGTRARVEIGDQPNFQECRQLEVQIPTAWSEGSIGIKINRGAFAPGSQAYLFVIREHGGINRDGLPTTLQ